MSDIRITGRIMPSTFSGAWGNGDTNEGNLPLTDELIYDDTVSQQYSTLRKGHYDGLQMSNYQGQPEDLSIYHSQYSDNAISADRLGSLSKGSGTQPIYFDKGQPVASTSSVGSSLVPIRMKDGVLQECSGIEDTFVKWSNTSTVASILPIDAAMSSLHSANRFAFAKAAGITIEYSRDGGATYVAYPDKTDEDKIQLVSGIGENFYIGGHNTDVTVNDKLRVTLNATNMGVYTKLRKILLQITTQGASGCTVTVEQATKGAIDNFTKIKDYSIDGWSGWNSIPMNGIAFGGGTNQTSNIGAIRLTFNIAGVSSSYSSALTLLDIVAIGETYWSYPSTMAKTGHLYNYDANKNATFPGEVTATKFNGPATTISEILPLSLGGTGKSLGFTQNAIIRFSSTAGANHFSSTPTKNGAFYATADNGSAQFGTLPIAQGGTGATTAANALKNFGLTATKDQLNQLATYSFTTTVPSDSSTDTTVPTSKAVYTIVSNSFAANDAMRFKGVLNKTSDLPANCAIGDTYRVATAGTYAGESCEVGDLIIAVKDATTANNDNWTIVQTNIDGAVMLSSGAVDAGSDSQPIYIKNNVVKASKYTDWVHSVTSSNTNGCIKVKTNDTTDSNVMVYAHPEDYGAKTGGSSSNQTPGFGETFTVHQMTSDKYGHVTGATDRTVKIPNTAATTSAAGLMSAADKTKLDGIATGANKYTHPSYTARTGKPSENLIPNFGDTITISQITSDSLGHVTGATDRTITIPSTAATTSNNGLMPKEDKFKLDKTNIAYGTSSTAAGTATKVVTVPSNGNTKWALVPGSQISVKFSNTNTASSPKLDVNGTGAKTISFANKLPYLIAGFVYTFAYDGTNFVLLDEYHRVDGLGGVGAEVFNDSSNVANGQYSHAEGAGGTVAGDEGSHAEGYGSWALNKYSHAEGEETVAEGQGSHAEGHLSDAQGNYSHAEGDGSIAIGIASHAEGCSIAEGERSHAEGDGSMAIGFASHAEGEAQAQGNYSHAEGGNLAEDGITKYETCPIYINQDDSVDVDSTTAMGVLSHAEGCQTLAYGYGSHSEGQWSSASGDLSHAEGANTFAFGYSSHAEGEWAMAEGIGSHAEGSWTTATGYASHAEGVETLAEGFGSHAEGGNMSIEGSIAYPSSDVSINPYDETDTYTIYSTTAVGIHAHAEGGMTLASGHYSHAEGEFTVATGESAHAEGVNTLAAGNYSHVEGYGTKTAGYCSHAEGSYTFAASDDQHVQGKYNIPDENGTYAHIVGNGTWQARSNAYTLDWEGNSYQSGKTMTMAAGAFSFVYNETTKSLDFNFA